MENERSQIAILIERLDKRGISTANLAVEWAKCDATLRGQWFLRSLEEAVAVLDSGGKLSATPFTEANDCSLPKRQCPTCKGNGRVEMLEHCPTCLGCCEVVSLNAAVNAVWAVRCELAAATGELKELRAFAEKHRQRA